MPSAKYFRSGSEDLKVKAQTTVAAYWAKCGHCGSELWASSTSSFMVPTDELTAKQPTKCLECGASNYSGRPLHERRGQ